MIWQLYDWYLSPNAGYYYTKKACESLHIQLHIDDQSVSVINSHLESRNNLLAIANVYSQNMERIWNKKTRMSIGPNSSKMIFKAEIPEEFKKNVYFVELQLFDSRKELLSENFYWRDVKPSFSANQ